MRCCLLSQPKTGTVPFYWARLLSAVACSRCECSWGRIALSRNCVQDKLARGFSTFKLRHTGRYDMEIKDFDKPSFAFLREKAPWLPLVHAILGPDCVLNHTGTVATSIL